MLISKSRYLSLFNVFFSLDEIFYHFRKRRGPRASRTCADQGPHTVVFNIFGFHCAILTLDAKGFAMLPAQSLRFRETGGHFWEECQLYRKFSNSYCLAWPWFCFNSNCNRLLSQIKTPIFYLLSRQKLETIDDLLSISLLIGSIVDRLEINFTDLVVSYNFV